MFPQLDTRHTSSLSFIYSYTEYHFPTTIPYKNILQRHNKIAINIDYTKCDIYYRNLKAIKKILIFRIVFSNAAKCSSQKNKTQYLKTVSLFYNAYLFTQINKVECTERQCTKEKLKVQIYKKYIFLLTTLVLHVMSHVSIQRAYKFTFCKFLVYFFTYADTLHEF